MAFYLVRNDGTATGDAGRYPTLPGGGFDSVGPGGFYPLIEQVIPLSTTKPTGGDTIVVSHLHDGFDDGISIVTTVKGLQILVISVDDTDMAQYLPGAVERCGTDILSLQGGLRFRGVSLLAGAWVNIAASSQITIEDGLLQTGTSDTRMYYDGTIVHLINTDIVHPRTEARLHILNGNQFIMDGGSITSTTGTITHIMFSGFLNGGGSAEFNGTALDQADIVLGGVGSDALTDDKIDVKLNRCKLSPSVMHVEEVLSSLSHTYTALGCYSTGDGGHGVHIERSTGTIEDQTQIIRDESEAFPNGEKTTLKMSSNANASPGNPLTLDILSLFAPLSDVASNTIRIYFASASALTDIDIWATLIYPNAVTSSADLYLSNRGTGITIGVAHTDDSGGSTWLDGGVDAVGYNEYYMDIDTSALPGGDGVPTIAINLSLPLVDVFIDPAPGLI